MTQPMFNSKKLTKIGFLAVSAAFLTGCASAPMAQQEPVKQDANIQKLNATAAEIAQSLTYLAKLQQGQVDEISGNGEKGINKAFRVSWNGSAADLASQVAFKIGYSFSVSGHNGEAITPDVFPYVAKSEKADDILRAVAARLAPVAEVRVSQNNRTIEIAYK